MKFTIKILTLLIYVLTLSACTLEPPYQRPPVDTANEYKEAGQWDLATPHKAEVMRKAWWTVFNDEELNCLEDKVFNGNENLQAALARFDEARAVAGIARSAYFPTIRGIANISRQHVSGTIANAGLRKRLFNDILIGADLNYELDVWGRVRNAVKASEFRAEASGADVAAVDLSLHAELAIDYFTLRADETKIDILDKLANAYQRALTLVRHRKQEGIASAVDVYQAELQLENVKTLAEDMVLKRAQMEHAIAVLVGENPSCFSIQPATLQKHFIAITPDLPSTLLERRPDIASAELSVAAANARIGVARAAFFPDFNLGGNVGFESEKFEKLFNLSSLFWSLGAPAALSLIAPLMTVVLFDGGKIRNQLNQADATYYETVAKYRQTVLTAFQEVEDNLAAQRQLEIEYHTQSAATTAAEGALKQTSLRYFGGIATFLDVVVTENLALQSELAFVDIVAQRQIASVGLIRALGGGVDNCNS